MEVKKKSVICLVITMATKWLSFLCFYGGLIQDKISEADKEENSGRPEKDFQRLGCVMITTLSLPEKVIFEY